jgi:hypothetical protein
MALTVGAAATFTTENTGVFYTATVATSGNNRGLLVFVATTSQSTPHNMRYNGVTMTQEIAAQEPDTGKRIAIWSLVAPATGGNSLVMSFSAAAAMALTAIPITDADQTDFVTNVAAFTGSATSAGFTGFTSTATEVVIDGIAWSGTTGAVGPQQTQLSNLVSGGTSIRNATSYESGSASVAMSWSLGAATNWIAAGVSCKSVSADPISQGPSNTSVSIFSVANASTDNTGSAMSITVSVSGTAAALVVFISNSSQSFPHGVRYSATALTNEGFTQEVPTGKYMSIWSLIGPAAGTNTITISFSAAVAAATTVFALYNVDQIDMVGNYVGASGSSASMAMAISAQAGELVLYGIGTDFNGNVSPTNTDATLRSLHGNPSCQIATASKPSSSDNNLTWSLSGLDDWVHGAVNVRPYVLLAGKAPRAHLSLSLQRYRECQRRDFYSIYAGPVAENNSVSTGPAPSNTGSIGPRVSLPPQTIENEEQWRRQAQTWMVEANQGRINNTGIVTLDANAASTVVNDDRVGKDSYIGLMPRTANAAVEQGNGTLYVVCGKKTFTIAHANNGQTDRVFTYSILG